MNSLESIRREYPALKDQVYLDTATTGLLSNRSHAAISAHLDRRHKEGVCLKEYFDLWKQADELRGLMGQLIGASGDEIFYGKDCSEILNALTANIEIPAGANVVIPDMSFPSTRNAWLARESDGLEVRYARSKNGGLSTQDLLEMTDDSTLAISLCMVEPSSGFRHDVERIGTFCRERGILLVIDATQCLSAMAIDVHKMNIDFLAASTYKWMNNVFGFGLGFMSQKLLSQVHAGVVGWVGASDRVGDFGKLTYQESDQAKRFETGGLNWIGLLGMAEAVKTCLELGQTEIQTHILELVDYLYESVDQVEGVEVVEPFEAVNRSNIVYLTFPKGFGLSDQILAENGIRAHVAGNAMRVGLHFYNNRQDVDALIEFLNLRQR